MADAKREVSDLDKRYHKLLRDNVSRFIEAAGQRYDGVGLRVLDIAPQDHEGAKPYFRQAEVETLDIDPASRATYIADICESNGGTIPDAHFDIVLCTEVLEHTLQPFMAVEEISRILKPGGIALVSTPFNFRIHGPLPDCWRFTEHGLRALFKDFSVLSLDALEEPNRFLAPIHYTLVAQKA
jgi:SAM-dependent methyltransferase